MLISNIPNLTSMSMVRAKVDLYDGPTLVKTCTCSDVLSDFVITREGDNSKFFGFGICHKLDVNFIDIDRVLTVNKGNTAEIGLGDGETLWDAPYPTFYITELQRDEKTNTITGTAYDKLYWAGEYLFADLGLEAPYTLRQVAQASATKLGLTLSIPSAISSAFDLSYESGANLDVDSTEPLRSVLNWLAEATQTIYYVNNLNNLVFKRLDKNGAAVETITKDDYYELNTKTPRVLDVICNATELGDNLKFPPDGEGTIQYIRNNPFIELRTDIDQFLENAFTNVGGTVITQFNCDWAGNYLLEIGDRLALETEDGAFVYSYLLSDTVSFAGTLSEITEWEYTDEQPETYANPTNIGERINQTFAKVNKIEKEIKLYVGDVVNEAVGELVDRAINESIGDIQEDIQNLQTNDTATNELLTQLQTDLGELEKQGAATEQKITQLTLTTDGINASVESLSSEQTTIKNNLNTVSGEQETIKNDIAALKITDNEIKADVSSLEQSHTTLNTKVTGIEGEVSTVKTEQSTLKQQQATLTTNLEGITGRVSEVEEKNTEIEDEVAGIKASQAETSHKVTTLETNLNGITGRVESVESKNTEHSNEISGIKSTQSQTSEKLATLEVTLNGISGKVSAVEASQTSLENEVSGVKQTQTTHSEKLATMETTLDGFTTRVSSVESKNSTLENELDGVKETQNEQSEQLAEITGDFESITTRVKSVEDKNTSLENEVTGVKTTQSTHSAKLAELTTSLDGITGRVSDVESTTSTLENEVSGVKSTQTTQSEKLGTLELTVNGFDTRISNAETTVSEVEDELTGIKSTQTNHTERLASLEIDADGIKSSVETVQKNVDTTNGYIDAQTEQLRTEIQQTANGLSLDIQTVRESGAARVTTSTGYTFDEDGLTVSKSTSDISTQITEDGMTVSNATTELLSATSEGVSATDLHARTYLSIGDRSRFENYGESRTGCFWIGN